MTIEELADFTGPQLKALTNEQLLEILTPYFPKTRPELVKKHRETNKPKQEVQPYLSPNKLAAISMLEDEGLDLSFLTKARRKKR